MKYLWKKKYRLPNSLAFYKFFHLPNKIELRLTKISQVELLVELKISTKLQNTTRFLHMPNCRGDLNGWQPTCVHSGNLTGVSKV